MRSRATGDMVAVRALVVATLSTLLAAVAHVSAGGLLPEAWTLGAMLALTAAGSAMVLTREISRTGLALLLVGAQATIHFEMTALAGHVGGHGPAASTATGALADALHHTAHHAVADAPMTVAHLLAAGATGVLLGHAERALFAVVALLHRATAFVKLVLASGHAIPAPRPRRAHPQSQRTPRRTSLWLADTVVRRGPPALLHAR